MNVPNYGMYGSDCGEKELGAQDARKDWCKCCDEFSIMCTEEVKTILDTRG